MLIENILFKTKDAFSQAAHTPSRVTLDFHEARKEFNDQGEPRYTLPGDMTPPLINGRGYAP